MPSKIRSRVSQDSFRSLFPLIGSDARSRRDRGSRAATSSCVILFFLLAWYNHTQTQSLFGITTICIVLERNLSIVHSVSIKTESLCYNKLATFLLPSCLAWLTVGPWKHDGLSLGVSRKRPNRKIESKRPGPRPKDRDREIRSLVWSQVLKDQILSEQWPNNPIKSNFDPILASNMLWFVTHKSEESLFVIFFMY